MLLSQQDIQSILEKNRKLDMTEDDVRLFAEDFEITFNKHFRFRASDIKDAISKIFATNDRNIVERLSDVYDKFVKLDGGFKCSEKRREFAKTVIRSTVDYYSKKNGYIEQEFFDMLEEAKKLKIDPYALAIMKNFDFANSSIRRKDDKSVAERFQESVEALVKEKYVDKVDKSTSTLFDEKLVKAMFEKCATIACDLSADNIQRTLDILSDLVYDESLNDYFKDENGSYITKPRDIILSLPSLLTVGPERIEKNIKFLLANCLNENVTKLDLIKYIKDAPSILTVSPKKIADFEEKLFECFQQILSENALNKPADFAKTQAHAFCSDYKNLISINNISSDRMQYMMRTKEVLSKHKIGAENLLKCITNPYILSMDYKLLDGLLAKLTLEERKTGKKYREYFLSHPSRVLENLKKGESIMGTSQKETASRNSTVKRERIKLEKVPVGMNESEAQAILDDMSAAQSSKIKSMFEGLLESSKDMEEDISYALEDLKSKKYRHPMFEILDRIEVAYDLVKGEGQAEKKFNLQFFRTLYNDLMDVCENVNFKLVENAMTKLHEMFDKLDVMIFARETDADYLSAQKEFGIQMRNFSSIFNAATKKLANGFNNLKKISEQLDKFESCLKENTYLAFTEICPAVVTSVYTLPELKFNAVVSQMMLDAEEVLKENLEIVVPNQLLDGVYGNKTFHSQNLMLALESLMQKGYCLSKDAVQKMKTNHLLVNKAPNIHVSASALEAAGIKQEDDDEMFIPSSTMKAQAVAKCAMNILTIMDVNKLRGEAIGTDIRFDDKGLYIFFAKEESILFFPDENLDKERMANLKVDVLKELPEDFKVYEITNVGFGNSLIAAFEQHVKKELADA